MGGLLVLKAAERAPVAALRADRARAAAGAPRARRARTWCATSPTSYGRSELGWATLPEKLQREHRDLTLADVLRIQHLLGQKPFESGRARRQMLAGRARRPRARCPTSRGSSSAAGSTPTSRSPSVERLAEWLDAPYEPFGAHSHYGLVLGEQSYLQVAETIRAFLETNRL